MSHPHGIGTLAWICLGVLLGGSVAAVDTYDWEEGPWGIIVGSGGTPDSSLCAVNLPGGVKTGNVLAVHYALDPTHAPQLWALLTDGLWRQTSQESEFLMSCRLFRCFSSHDEVHEP